VSNQTKLFWQDVRAMLDRDYPEAFTVAEWESWEASEAGFHSNYLHWKPQFYDLWFRNNDSFFLPAGKGDITAFLSLYLDERRRSLGKNYISLTVGNHDLPRVARWGRDKTDLELIQVFCFTMPNVPFIYYGDEIGMRQLPIDSGKEGCYGTRAGGRTPMQWGGSVNLGFSTGAPHSLWMPVDPAPDAPTVAAQEGDPDSMLSFVRSLVAFRKAHPALAADGGFFPVFAQPKKYPFVFLRTGGGETLLVAINPSAEAATATIKGGLEGARTLLSGSECAITESGGTTTITLPARSYAIYDVGHR
jgi:maltose alpha-D-glucosyltransferase/alpha-amylase